MPRERMIVGLGEALLREHPDRTEPGGMAASVAMQAARLGQRGIVISRVGQDPQADELLALLDAAGVTTEHVQSDPDLPTGRVSVRAIGGSSARYLEERAAFDNLQSDFDLEDVAQQADAVVFGMLTRRSGQTRSEENRFLEACRAAIRVFDLTNRGAEDGANSTIDRGHAASGLELCDIIIVDRDGLAALRPRSASSPMHEAAASLLRESPATCVLALGPDGAGDATEVLGLTADATATVRLPAGRRALDAFVVAVLVGLLNGREFASALETAARVATHAHEHPGEPVPEDLLA